MNKTTIIIADDHKLVREGWRMILDSDPAYQVVALCGSAEEAIEEAKKLRPDIVLMDINLPGINGIEAIPLIRKFSPASKIIGMSMHTQPSYVKTMLQKGAVGYVTKNSSRTELFKAIEEVLAGRKYICSEIKDIFSEQLLFPDSQQNDLNSLSSREIQIIHYLKNGFSSKQIAEALYLSVKTIEAHRYNILKKLKLNNTAALINFITSNYPEL